MEKGDFLNPHIDNSHDKNKRKYRKLNLLYYVTPKWHKEYGRNLELWDEKVKRKRLITAKFNRLVSMETNKRSWHSVNTNLINKKRCCASNYYFSTLSSYKNDYYHVTTFTGRPDEKLKRFYCYFDNLIRNQISLIFKKFILN
jgi:Rps23 Pro-64 3,4-dihydroxylase Tpa1-like proline 4-hydroxylase